MQIVKEEREKMKNKLAMGVAIFAAAFGFFILSQHQVNAEQMGFKVAGASQDTASVFVLTETALSK